jgi:hypothetical protein
MSEDNRLPPTPSGRLPRSLDPRGFSPDASEFSNVEPKHREFPTMEENHRSTMTGSRRSKNFLTPKIAIALIFFGAFIFSVLFTSAILSGLIEIQPAAIKLFFRSIFGKN